MYTIGFSRKTAAEFFQALRRAGIKRVVDVRLNNTSQLAGFTKRGDLTFFLKELCNAEYTHETLLAPTYDLLRLYKREAGDWNEYESRFLALMASRKIEERLNPALLDGPTVFLCSEPSAEHCHRRLVLEYLRDRWGPFEIVHL